MGGVGEVGGGAAGQGSRCRSGLLMKCYAIGKRSTRPTPLTTFPYHLEDLQTARDLVQRDLEVGELDRRAGTPGKVSLGLGSGLALALARAEG